MGILDQGDMLMFYRHKDGERVLKRNGVKGLRQWVCILPWVHYVIGLDVVIKRFTASYSLHPVLQAQHSAGRNVVHIDHDSMPMILPAMPKGVTMPAYQTMEAAVAACQKTHLELQLKIGM